MRDTRVLGQSPTRASRLHAVPPVTCERKLAWGRRTEALKVMDTINGSSISPKAADTTKKDVIRPVTLITCQMWIDDEMRVCPPPPPPPTWQERKETDSKGRS